MSGKTKGPGTTTRASRPSPRSQDRADAPPRLPPPSAEEVAASRSIIARLQEIALHHHRENLENAVRLAQQALAQGGELEGHFAEIGRRYVHLLDQPAKKPASRGLRVIEGGAGRDAPGQRAMPGAEPQPAA